MRKKAIISVILNLPTIYIPTSASKAKVTSEPPSCLSGFSAKSQRYLSFTLNQRQPPTTRQQYFSLTAVHHQPLTTSQAACPAYFVFASSGNGDLAPPATPQSLPPSPK